MGRRDNRSGASNKPKESPNTTSEESGNPNRLSFGIDSKYRQDIGRSDIRRRRFILGSMVIGSTATSGCLEFVGLGESLTWEEAFKQELNDQDYSTLEPTPILAESVTTEAEVETALGVLGWTRAGSDMAETLPADLEVTAALASNISDQIRSIVEKLDSGLSLVDEMKETGIGGVTAWDTLTSLKPGLDQLETAMRELRSQLQSIQTRTETISTSSTETTDYLSELAVSQTTDYDALPGSLQTTSDELGSISQDINDVRDRIRNVQSMSDEAVEATGELPAFGSQVSSVFGTLSAHLGSLADQLDQFLDNLRTIQTDLDAVHSEADEVANQRFEPISDVVTGSAQTMSVSSIDTTVDAYEEPQSEEEPQPEEESFPEDTIRWVIPSKPGSRVDVYARAITEYLPESVKNHIELENTMVDSPIFGTNDVYNSEPDGYTIIILNVDELYNKQNDGHPEVRYDLFQMSYLCQISTDPLHVIAGPPNIPNDRAEILRAAITQSATNENFRGFIYERNPDNSFNYREISSVDQVLPE